MKNNKWTLDHIKEYWVLYLIIWLPIILLVLLTVFKTDRVSSNTTKNVHWHIPITYELCGDETQLKDSWNHGTLHGHDDAKIHVEGFVDSANRKETLGAFFDSANISFSENNIWSYINGNSCVWSENPWTLSVIINGIENFEYRNYMLNNKDEITVIFQ